MTKKQAEFIVQAAEHEGLDDIKIYEGYSGRGMYGDTTYGITATRFSEVLAVTLRFALEAEVDEDNEGLFDDFEPRQDQLGLGIIIY